MKVRCRLRDIRGKRPLKELADESGVARATLNLIENGRQLPKDEHVQALEGAYRAPRTSWYSDQTLLAIVEDDVA